MEFYGIEVLDQYWLVNGLRARVPVGVIEAIVIDPDVVYIEPANEGTSLPFHVPEHADSNPNNDVASARTQIQSDSYFDATTAVSSIGVLDIATHIFCFSFQATFCARRDCVHGEPVGCKKVTSSVNYDPIDTVGHGTSTIAITTANSRLGNSYCGITRDIVDEKNA